MPSPHPISLHPRSFEAAARVYLDWYRDEHADRPSTWRRVAVSFTALTAAFGRLPLAAIGASNLESYKSNRRRAVKAVTIRHDLHALSGLFQYAIRQGWVTDNAVRKITVPSDRDAVRIRVLTEREELEYLGAAESHTALYAVTRLMLSTGMRPGEVLGLRVGDFDAGNRKVTIRKGKTAAAKRSIRLSTVAAELAASLTRERKQREWLFPGAGPDRPLTKLNGVHERVCRRAGVRFCLYDCRHTFASRAAAKGMPLTTLAAILGHNGIRCVMRYIHPNQAAMDEAMERYAG